MQVNDLLAGVELQAEPSGFRSGFPKACAVSCLFPRRIIGGRPSVLPGAGLR